MCIIIQICLAYVRDVPTSQLYPNAVEVPDDVKSYITYYILAFLVQTLGLT